MEPIRNLSEDEISAIYRQEEGVVVALIQSMNETIIQLTKWVQILEDQLAKNSQ